MPDVEWIMENFHINKYRKNFKIDYIKPQAQACGFFVL